MEDAFDNFIKSLTDHELAIYIGYQYPSFLSYSKKKILKEIIYRSLSKDQLKNYFQTKLSYDNKAKFCERCGSNKFIEDIDVRHKRGRYFSSDVEIKTMRCRLCNHNPSKAPAKNIFDRIKRLIFDSNKSEETLKVYDWGDFS